MPKMDGYEVCRKLNNLDITSDIPVILLTGLSEIEDEFRGLDVGGIDYINKPSCLEPLGLCIALAAKIISSMKGLIKIYNRGNEGITIRVQFHQSIREEELSNENK
jgi:CheY-like chemotaxis protein